MRINQDGYRMVKIDEARGTRRYIAEHTVIAEKTLGRCLARHEVVHHINGIRDDNRPENLVVCTRSQHMAIHAELQSIALMMARDGVLIFENGHYRRAKEG